MPSTTAGIITGEPVTRDGKRRRQRKRHADGRGHQREAHGQPERIDYLVVVQDRPEPAQRRAVEGQRDEALVSERDGDHDDQRRGNEAQK
jgi:hypothetical protein